jgi:hypothetical protein
MDSPWVLSFFQKNNQGLQDGSNPSQSHGQEGFLLSLRLYMAQHQEEYSLSALRLCTVSRPTGTPLSLEVGGMPPTSRWKSHWRENPGIPSKNLVCTPAHCKESPLTDWCVHQLSGRGFSWWREFCLKVGGIPSTLRLYRYRSHVQGVFLFALILYKVSRPGGIPHSLEPYTVSRPAARRSPSWP